MHLKYLQDQTFTGDSIVSKCSMLITILKVRQIANVTIDISKILEHEPTHNERVMLEHFSIINSLVIDLEALALFRLCMMVSPHTRVLEIGSYRGGSTVAIGHAAMLNQLDVFCIDIWSEYQQQSDFNHMDKAQLNDLRILAEFIANTSFIKDRLFMLRGDAVSFSPILGCNLFSLVFVDGAHDYYSVVDDILCALKVIKPGGILCGHDYHSAGIDVKKAVHDVIMLSETITSKGLIEKTSIWYAVIEDPEYELLLVNTIKQMALGNFVEALALLTEGSESVEQTKEIDCLRKGLEFEISLL